MMRQGGNSQVRKFFQKIEIENSPIQTLYCTKGASHYRDRLRERVDKIMSGEIKSEKRLLISSPKKTSVVRQDTIDKSSGLNNSQASPNSVRTEFLKIMFPEGPMGMTLTKDHRELALVSKLLPGGK